MLRCTRYWRLASRSRACASGAWRLSRRPRGSCRWLCGGFHVSTIGAHDRARNCISRSRRGTFYRSKTAVVSMSCRLLFEEQDAAYKKAVLGTTRASVEVEAAVEMGWERDIGL